MRFRFFLAIFIAMGSLGCQKETTVTVSSVDFWTDTGIDVKVGQTISISAEGEVYGHYNPPERVWGPLGPEGQTDESADSLWMLPGSPKIALIAKIGEDGTPLKIGASASFSTERKGRLFLGVNDRVYLHPSDHHYVEGESRQMHTGCYEDNKGQFTVQLRVK
ncbi:MAG: hypothetical protein ACE5IR_06165 [bacterium]